MGSRNGATRVGIFVDVANMYLNGGPKLQYDVLREFACRDEAEAVRMNAYVTYDTERAEHDEQYRKGAQNFHSALRDLGYKVIVKEIQWYNDEYGNRYGKANADLDLAIDALLQSEKLDRVLFASGDGDFAQVVRTLQNRGLRVEVIALDNVSTRLRQEADFFMSGYLIPNLIPVSVEKPEQPMWGDLGSRVRGWCYWHSEQGFGFMRYIKEISPMLWMTDTREAESPYGTAFFHDSNLPDFIRPSLFPNRSLIFEFSLSESDRGGRIQASEIELTSKF